jgi:hypothetical protein
MTGRFRATQVQVDRSYIMQQIFGKIRLHLHRMTIGGHYIGRNQGQVDCAWGFYSNTAPRHDAYGRNNQRFAHLIDTNLCAESGDSSSFIMFKLLQYDVRQAAN